MQSAEEISQKTIDLLERLHAIVVGPGLGRDNLMQDTAAKIIEAAKARNMPMVVDAVWHPQAHPLHKVERKEHTDDDDDHNRMGYSWCKTDRLLLKTMSRQS